MCLLPSQCIYFVYCDVMAVCSGVWGFVPGTIVPQGPSEKCLCVFCLLVFFSAPNFLESVASNDRHNVVVRYLFRVVAVSLVQPGPL